MKIPRNIWISERLITVLSGVLFIGFSILAGV